MKKLFFYIFFSFIYISLGQNKEPIYLLLDEDNKFIDMQTYKKKCNSFLFDCKLIDRDTIQILSMKQLYKFGKLDSIENNQIRLLLKRTTKQNYNNNKTLIIYLKDTIVGYSYKKKKWNKSLSQIKTLDTIYKGNYYILSETSHNDFRKRFDINQKGCRKKYNKKNIDVVYFYDKDFDYKYKPKNFTFYKIPSALKKIFFGNNNTGYVILKPDGNYFYYRTIRKKKLEELFDNDWGIYITEYKWILKNLPVKRRSGFFKNIEYKYNSNFQCYCKTYSEY